MTSRATQYAGPDSDFRDWLETVDGIVLEMSGVSAFDLADYPYRDAYDSGVDPAEVAEDVLHEDGFPFEVLD